MSLLVVGSVALDSVETPFGTREDVLGGSATYFAAAASLLTRVSVVGVVGEDFPSAQLAFLRARGVEMDGLSTVPGKTFRWKGRYGFDLNAAETLDTQLNVFEHFAPQLGPRARKAERIFLGNIDPVLQLRVLEQAERPRLVCADTMNYWISSKRAQLQQLLPRVDVLMVNDAEVRQLAGESNVLKAAQAAQRMGAKAVVVKRGEYGALLVAGGHSFYAPAFPLADVVDPTGAGDTFAGGFLGLLDRLDSGDAAALRQATVMGSTIASFTVEQFSLDRLRELDLTQVRQRFDAFRQLVHFDELPAHVA
ncbi:MAG TPA: PfkB family carbohydrate kinase [Myxococcales bacterium]|nr:PfkB family carbohydrate kinase [Myxococcales bacterium]